MNQKLTALVAIIGFALTNHSAAVGRCSGGAGCRACVTCSACKHCSQDGGTCSVCASVYSKGFPAPKESAKDKGMPFWVFAGVAGGAVLLIAKLRKKK